MPNRLTKAATVLLLTPLLVAACSSGSGSNSNSSSLNAPAKGTVHFWVRSCTQTVAQAMVKQFNAAHPHLKVEITPIQCGTGQAITKLATAIRAGSPPDLDGINVDNIPVFTHNGSLRDLTADINALPYKHSLSSGQIAVGENNGANYSVPYIADLSVLWYNKELFRRAGLNPNKPPTTFAEILLDARKIRALGNGIYGFSFAGNCAGCTSFALYPMMYAGGTALWKGPIGNQQATVTGNEPLQKLLQLLRTTWVEHLDPPSNRTDTGATFGADFVNGKVGIEPNGYGGIVNMLSKVKGPHSQFADAVLPGPTGGYSTYIGGDNFIIPKGANNPAGAWEFIKFVLQKQNQVQYPDLGFTPVRSDVLTSSFRARYPLDAVAVSALKNGQSDKSLASGSIDNTANSPWLEMIQQAAFNGDITGAMKKAQTSIDTILKKAGS